MRVALESPSPSSPDSADVARVVDDAITSRRSVRACLPTPVTRALLEHILAVASWPPSSTNMPPWCDRVVAGEAKDKLTIGYEDKQAAANKLQTERAPVSEFARFMGYET